MTGTWRVTVCANAVHAGLLVARKQNRIVRSPRGDAPPPDRRIADSLRRAAVHPIRFIFPAAKKPSERPSGDQKGFEAPSLPATSRTTVEPRARRKSRGPVLVVTAMANVDPSGEMTDETPRIP